MRYSNQQSITQRAVLVRTGHLISWRFFRIFAQRDEAATPDIAKALAGSSSLSSMEPVQEGWMVKWMQGWEL
jgi:hypothetical protein